MIEIAVDELLEQFKQLKFQKILILGCPGAGKTTFAEKLGKELNIPLIHLDDIYWEAGWVRPKEELFLQRLENILNQKSWIIDGNYSRYLKLRLLYAHGVVLIDAGMTICCWRSFKRFLIRVMGDEISLPCQIRQNASYKFRVSIAFKLFKNIITFPRKTLPEMRQLITVANLPAYIVNGDDFKKFKRVINGT